jgi:hypothetical protein
MELEKTTQRDVMFFGDAGCRDCVFCRIYFFRGEISALHPEMEFSRPGDSDLNRVPMQGYLAAAMKAVQEHGVKIKGYFAWSFCDNFEW